MRVFVWSRVGRCSDNYHSEGGVVVFAETEDRAREVANVNGCNIRTDELPDEVRECSGGEAAYWMPDAGCC